MNQVFIEANLCKGCRICASVCPKGLFTFSHLSNKKGYNYAVVEDSKDCIGCRSCERSCPDLAIYVESRK